jgi:hypothetical protein
MERPENVQNHAAQLQCSAQCTTYWLHKWPQSGDLACLLGRSPPLTNLKGMRLRDKRNERFWLTRLATGQGADVSQPAQVGSPKRHDVVDVGNASAFSSRSEWGAGRVDGT